MRKRIFAAFVCLCMLMALVPSMAYADGTASVGGLCEHHPQHDSACGYSEGTAEVPCNHEHTEDCYTLVTNCVHEHTAECYSDGILPAEEEEKTADNCSHQCSEESGCITKELNCNHEHDENCGYIPATAGTPCTYVCEICNAQDSEEAECICETKCTEEEINENCPVCGENGDISACVGAEKAEEPQCVYETKCTEEEPNADCPVCGGENGDISGCVGAAMMLAPMGAGAITPEVPDGVGTEGDPYQITNAAELYWFAGLVNGTLNGVQQNTAACAVLTTDITINDNVLNADGNLNSGTFTEWTPIGSYDISGEKAYTGTFDGNGHTISGLYVDSDARYIGLFGRVGNGGTIQNAGVVDSYISNTKNYANVGGVCGYNEGSIKNSYNTGSVSGGTVGGVCGVNCSTIENCYNTGEVSGGTVSGGTVGGVCGKNYGSIENSYNTGEVSGTSYVSGVCGKNYNGTIENCYNTGEVTGEGAVSYVGGVCEKNYNGTIENCYNTGEVTGEGEVSYVGGVCVENYNGTIENCYNTGSVSGSGNNVGGVCRYNNIGAIKNSYNTGSVSGSGNNVGGVCGLNNGKIENSYYLEGTADSSDGNVLSEQQFSVESSFNGWDFNSVWKMDSILGRPLLKNNTEIIDGTEEKPYLIYNVGQLKDFAKVVNSRNTDIHAKLMNDITINDNVLGDDGNLIGDGSNFEQWTPIGNDANPYTGTFDGDGHTISGLYVDSDAQYVGLFGCVGINGKIQNVGVVDSYISATGNGAIVGGVCGRNYRGTIENCYNTGTVTGSGINVGGVCGGNSWNIINCYNTGKVSTTDDTACVGGVCGYNTENIKNCYNTGKISVTIHSSFVGGVCGMNFGGINNCYFLTGTADKGIGVGSSIFPNEATEKTENQFKSGEVAWLLNGSQNPQLWGQGSNDMPVLTSNPPEDVTCTAPVRVTIQMPDGTAVQYGYTTAGEALAEYPSHLNGKTYTFYEDSNFATPIDTATKTYEKDTVIYAKEKKNSSGGSVFFWDLKFDTNGGSKIDTVTEWEYSTIDLDEYVPEKEGYKFVGWYADEDLTKKIDEVYLLENTTVYAKWEKIEEEVPEEPDETEEIKETETISFKDVKESDWFYEAVSYAVENGLMSGMSEDIFAPNTPLTREMLAVVLYNVEGQPESTEANTFTDVKGDMWYTEAILWANENGIVAGYDNGAYGVGDLITREQFATILYRYAQFKGYDTTQGGMAVREFSDYENISDYARPAMAWAVNAGIMGGMDDGTLMPQGKATRAEAATMLMQFCEQVVK